jgi:hypothetical protein
VQPVFLVPETTVHANGESPAAALDPPRASRVIITFGITAVVEQEAILVSIHGSADGQSWQPSSLVAFPQKFYPGVASVVIDLDLHPDVNFIRAQWKVTRWGRGDKTPSFAMYVFAEPA